MLNDFWMYTDFAKCLKLIYIIFKRYVLVTMVGELNEWFFMWENAGGRYRLPSPEIWEIMDAPFTSGTIIFAAKG